MIYALVAEHRIATLKKCGNITIIPVGSICLTSHGSTLVDFRQTLHGAVCSYSQTQDAKSTMSIDVSTHHLSDDWFACEHGIKVKRAKALRHQYGIPLRATNANVPSLELKTM